ncbi:unnamed protein product [Lupinus luteus]|uniref:Histone chaperone domain-containing protein n=1 Tax=Lupinus luteus TaxID=3873 RepID=A0AAV1W9H5_LUPLU
MWNEVLENRHEGQLIKELEEILSREGLSSNPSEKEIKEVRRKKDRAKELEGIDMSNIMSSSRSRRSTTSFLAPLHLKPKTLEKTNGNGAKDSGNDDKDDEGNDDERMKKTKKIVVTMRRARVKNLIKMKRTVTELNSGRFRSIK